MMTSSEEEGNTHLNIHSIQLASAEAVSYRLCLHTTGYESLSLSRRATYIEASQEVQGLSNSSMKRIICCIILMAPPRARYLFERAFCVWKRQQWVCMLLQLSRHSSCVIWCMIVAEEVQMKSSKRLNLLQELSDFHRESPSKVGRQLLWRRSEGKCLL